MRNTLKKTLAALAGLAIIPTTAIAFTVYPPHPGKADTATWSGLPHGAVDVSSGTCSYWGVEAPIFGSLSWNLTVRSSGEICYGNGSGNHNEAKHVFADGWTFRVWHFIKTADSYDRTCDRCQVGDEGATGNVVGAHTHLQRDKNGTKDTSWYEGYTVDGETLDHNEVIGVF
ncbi:hypothetical protein [Hyalangium sp.]|uniref:hypothetical protein n=1 Tax=Hyalangium sp. TaxID=2028555 RepID=UPI002D580CBA|nr:hypothetical protein [Hyalangium sp.]HYH96444.1 hypothetical protein [Hyalangium sp.]